jgi:hypothetical protein
MEKVCTDEEVEAVRQSMQLIEDPLGGKQGVPYYTTLRQ